VRGNATEDAENNGIVPNEYNHHHHRESYGEPPEIRDNIAWLREVLAAANKDRANERPLRDGQVHLFNTSNSKLLDLAAKLSKGILTKRDSCLPHIYVEGVRHHQSETYGAGTFSLDLGTSSYLWSSDFLPQPRDVELPKSRRFSLSWVLAVVGSCCR
jgi:hypothetical protein